MHIVALFSAGVMSLVLVQGVARASVRAESSAEPRARETWVRAVPDTLGRRLYELGCASCHGADGRGADPSSVAFTIPVPDFTDCSFASREPDADWIAVAHEGGPVRGFDRTMPAFGEAFDEAQLQSIMDYIRTMCADARWPRGELNLPRSFFTEKAYPEDEAVATVTVSGEGAGLVMNELLYEKRFGPRSQWEIVVPFGARQRTDGGDWNAGLGDVKLALKHALWHSLAAGSIVSVGSEVILPTGSVTRGFGSGTVVFEPFLSTGHILPADAFLQLSVAVELPVDAEKAEREAGWSAVLGRTFTQGRWGRAWSPMLEILGRRELEGGASIGWDAVPQMQITLNTRQHVMLNVGARLPLTDAGPRQTQFLLYLLWDWFDGGFFDGW
jgi:mono/diheme cytochrome c family protein